MTIILDYLSVSFGTYLGEVEEINKRLQKRGLDASAIIAILPHIVDREQLGVIVYYKHESCNEENKNNDTR